jgi:hypothetical protein
MLLFIMLPSDSDEDDYSRIACGWRVHSVPLWLSRLETGSRRVIQPVKVRKYSRLPNRIAWGLCVNINPNLVMPVSLIPLTF